MSLGRGVQDTLHLINPLSLFRFKAVSKIGQAGGCVSSSEVTDTPRTTHATRESCTRQMTSCSAVSTPSPTAHLHHPSLPSSPLPLSPLDLHSLQQIGLAYFLYLFLFSGLEYSLTFLVHQIFSYTR